MHCRYTYNSFGSKVSISIMHPSYRYSSGKGVRRQTLKIREWSLCRAWVQYDLIGMHEAQRVSNYSQLQSIIMGLVMLSLAVSH